MVIVGFIVNEDPPPFSYLGMLSISMPHSYPGGAIGDVLGGAEPAGQLLVQDGQGCPHRQRKAHYQPFLSEVQK